MATKEIALVEKYTGKQIAEDFLFNQELPLAGLLLSAVYSLQNTEAALERATEKLMDVVIKIRSNLAAGPSDRIYSLNPLGEVNSTDVDRLIGVRDEQIKYVRALTYTLLKARTQL